MRVVILWRENTDYAQTVRTWLHDFYKRTGRTLESLNPDEGEGERLMQAYGIMQFPSILALDDNGAVLAHWQGKMLPKIDDVNFYLLAN